MGTATFSGNGNYYIDVDAALVSQNVAGRYSTIYWRVNVVKTYGSGHMATTNMGNSGSADSSVGGLWGNGNMAYDFRNGSMQGNFLIAEGYFNVGHDGAGNASYYVNGALSLYALGNASAGTGWRGLPSLARVPDPPTPIGVDQITQTSMRYRFSGNYDGGAPIREWQALYQQEGGAQIPVGSDGTTVFTGLRPATNYNFWSRGRNDVGWGPWSNMVSARTLAGARVKHQGQWRDAVPYVRVNGVWRIAEPFVKKNGSWKRPS